MSSSLFLIDANLLILGFVAEFSGQFQFGEKICFMGHEHFLKGILRCFNHKWTKSAAQRPEDWTFWLQNVKWIFLDYCCILLRTCNLFNLKNMIKIAREEAHFFQSAMTLPRWPFICFSSSWKWSIFKIQLEKWVQAKLSFFLPHFLLYVKSNWHQ